MAGSETPARLGQASEGPTPWAPELTSPLPAARVSICGPHPGRGLPGEAGGSRPAGAALATLRQGGALHQCHCQRGGEADPVSARPAPPRGRAAWTRCRDGEVVAGNHVPAQGLREFKCPQKPCGFGLFSQTQLMILFFSLKAPFAFEIPGRVSEWGGKTAPRARGQLRSPHWGTLGAHENGAWLPSGPAVSRRLILETSGCTCGHRSWQEGFASLLALGSCQGLVLNSLCRHRPQRARRREQRPARLFLS